MNKSIIPLIRPIFDADEVDEIIRRHNADISQLKAAIIQAEKKETACRLDYDTSNEIYWKEYASACLLAIDILRSYPPIISREMNSSKYIDIESLKSQVDIVNVAERYTKLTKAGRNFKALCPFHTEKSPSFFVYPDRQTWHCFGSCSSGGDVINLVMRAENCDFKQAVSILSEGT